MIAPKNKQKKIQDPDKILLVAGVALTLGWSIIVALGDALNYHIGGQPPVILFIAPLIVGSLCLSLSISYNLKINPIYKVLITLVGAIPIYAIAYIIFIFARLYGYGLSF